ncbi:MAG: hypothetical protein U0T82_09120 [Bacteroidales bacterium]
MDSTSKEQYDLEIILETDYVTRDGTPKIKLCEICLQLVPNYVKTALQLWRTRKVAGSYTGATAHDLILMRKHSGPKVKVKASGGVRTLSELLKYKEIGISRCGATATVVMLEEAKKMFGE